MAMASAAGGGHPETSLKDRDQAVDGVDVRGDLGVPEGDGNGGVRGLLKEGMTRRRHGRTCGGGFVVYVLSLRHLRGLLVKVPLAVRCARWVPRSTGRQMDYVNNVREP